MTPQLSVVVIAHRMAHQAENTLRTLSPSYQRGVTAEEYEVVVVENPSGDELGAARAESTGPNVVYVRGPGGTSPAAAVNAGMERCRAAFVCLMIDGARMVTPRVLQYGLWARRITQEAVVAVPGYHLGAHEHHAAADYDEARERELLASVPWRENGYRLFDVSVASGANPRGVFHPLMESNCLFFTRRGFDEIGGAPTAFDLPGGGSLNLYLYRRLALREGTQLFVLPGEGSFHQYHGGVTTRADPDRDAVLASHRAQLARLLGQPYEAPKREPVLLGAVTSWALPHLRSATQHGTSRFGRLHRQGTKAWPDDAEPTE